MAEEEFFDEDLLSKGYLPEDEAVTDLGSITPGNVPDNNFNEDLLSQGYDAEIPDSSLPTSMPIPVEANSPTLYGDALNFLKNSDLPFLDTMATGLDSILPSGDAVGEVLPEALSAVGGAAGGIATLNPLSATFSGGGSPLLAPAAIAGGSTIGRHLGDQVGKALGIRSPDINAYQSDASSNLLEQGISGAADLALPFAGQAIKGTVAGFKSLKGMIFSKAVDITEALNKGDGLSAIKSIPKAALGKVAVDMGDTKTAAKTFTDIISKAQEGFKKNKIPKSEWGVAFQGLVKDAGDRVSSVIKQAEEVLPSLDYTPNAFKKVQETAKALGLEEPTEGNALKILRVLEDDVDFSKLLKGQKTEEIGKVGKALVQNIMEEMGGRSSLRPSQILSLKNSYDTLVYKAAQSDVTDTVEVMAIDKMRYAYRQQLQKATRDADAILGTESTLSSAFQTANKEYYPYKLLGKEEVEMAGQQVVDTSGKLLQKPSFLGNGLGVALNAGQAGEELYEDFASAPAPTIVPPPTVNSMDESGKVSDPIDRKVIGSQAEEIYKKDPVSRFETKKANNTGKAIPAKFINDAGGQAPEEVSEEVSYLRDKEGALKQPYVLKGEGVTLSTGLYLGDKDADSLREMGVTNEKLISKLSPVLGEKSERRAKALLASAKLKLSTKELEELEKASINYHNGVTEKDFKAITGEELSDAPKPARMVLYSLGYLSGSIKRTKESSIRKVVGLIAEGKYSRAYTALVSLSKSKNYKHANRFAKEAETLSQLVNENQYASYDSTEKVASTVTLPDGKVKTNYS